MKELQQFDRAVGQIVEVLTQRTQLNPDAAHGKAVRAVSYEIDRRECNIRNISQESDWEDVRRIVGERRFDQICDYY